MNSTQKQETAKIIIRILKSRFDNYPEDATVPRNAPFHKAFLQAFSREFDNTGTDVDAIISMSSWMHGLNTTLGQTFFESVAHILCDGEKRGFNGNEYRVYSEQERVINELMTDLKNGNRRPSVYQEDRMIAEASTGNLVTGTDFTVDCYYEYDGSIVAIELKSVRPNSGETRGEKQKILKAKAALKNRYPDKDVKYYFGFPFDPTASSDTGYSKKRFMNNIVEFTKFCDEDEILIAEELWSYLSGEEGTMQELLSLIRSIATEDFMEKFAFVSDPINMIKNPGRYIEIATMWALKDEITIARRVSHLKASPKKPIQKSLNLCTFDAEGKYNSRRANTLLEDS